MTTKPDPIDLGALEREVKDRWCAFVAARTRLEAEQGKLYGAIQERQQA